MLKSLKASISEASSEIVERCDISSLLHCMIDAVEESSVEFEIKALKRKFLTEKCKYEKTMKYAIALEEEKLNLRNELSLIKAQAFVLRDEFSHEVGKLLNQSRSHQKLKSKLKQAELKIAHYEAIEGEWAAAKRRIRELERISASREGCAGGLTPSTLSMDASSTGCDDASFSTNEKKKSIDDSSHSDSVSVATPISKTALKPDVTAGMENSVTVVVSTSTTEHEPKRTPLQLADLTDEIFLVVISFVEMGDILNVLLTCRHLCSRVYGMFEISYTDVVKEEWCNSKPKLLSDKVVEVEDTKEAIEEVKESKESRSVTSGFSGSRTTPINGTAPGGESKNLVDPKVTSSLTSSIANVFSSFGVSPVGVGGTSAVAEPVNRPSSGNTTVSSPPPAQTAVSTSNNNSMLTPDIVDGLTKKLTPNELKAIISIREREQRANALLRDAKLQLSDMTESKEMLAVKLESTEKSRDFLAHKISEAERALKSAFGEIKILKMQLGNDDKIIGFLDQQQQELTLQTNEWKDKFDNIQAVYDLQRGSHSRIEDQLQAEIKVYKNKLDSFEKDYKSQKKLLVKEVKALRIQLMEVSKDRDTYKSQIQALRSALGVHSNA